MIASTVLSLVFFAAGAQAVPLAADSTSSSAVVLAPSSSSSSRSFSATAGLVSSSSSSKATTTSSSASPSPTVLTPAKFLNLTNWSVQMPVGATANSTTFQQVYQPAFDKFTSPHFYVNAAQTAVVFHTPNTGITTGGSTSPRTELRQMPDVGTTGWNAYSSTWHNLTISAQIDRYPQGYNTSSLVIFAQILSPTQGAEITVRARDKKLIEMCTKTLGPCINLDTNYSFGEPFTFSFSASNNVTLVTYRKGTVSALAVVPLRQFGDFCFKTGAYCLMTPSTFPATEYCQVTMTSLKVV
ncbi:concanavalin A-like lectin/glucanase domain-containing protein [Chytriomyces cf. hyalinus JEL632]|nr:concanavalin A-like lectin/glucanase domain-containing protein [Chytriomyces cf. hyalinus JEL632]